MCATEATHTEKCEPRFATALNRLLLRKKARTEAAFLPKKNTPSYAATIFSLVWYHNYTKIRRNVNI